MTLISKDRLGRRPRPTSFIVIIGLIVVAGCGRVSETHQSIPDVCADLKNNGWPDAEFYPVDSGEATSLGIVEAGLIRNRDLKVEIYCVRSEAAGRIVVENYQSAGLPVATSGLFVVVMENNETLEAVTKQLGKVGFNPALAPLAGQALRD